LYYKEGWNFERIPSGISRVNLPVSTCWTVKAQGIQVVRLKYLKDSEFLLFRKKLWEFKKIWDLLPKLRKLPVPGSSEKISHFKSARKPLFDAKKGEGTSDFKPLEVTIGNYWNQKYRWGRVREHQKRMEYSEDRIDLKRMGF